MGNKVIRVLNENHGNQVIDYWKEQKTKEDGFTFERAKINIKSFCEAGEYMYLGVKNNKLWAGGELMVDDMYVMTLPQKWCCR